MRNVARLKCITAVSYTHLDVYKRQMYPNELHKWVALDDNSLVSMNMWGFTPQVFGEMKKAFDKFIDENGMDIDVYKRQA